MGFFDKFKPDYRNSDSKVRLKGIKKLDDNAILLDLCLNDKDKDVRSAALRKINFPGYFPLIIARSQDEEIRKEAFDRISRPGDFADVVELSKNKIIQEKAINKISKLKTLQELKFNADVSLHDIIDKRIEELKTNQIND
ncbi:MAG: HEAT repeat domain-containing protein [Methanobrevibacter sp.]|nr:HEAT repeat domain-containing protein [Methanobrevibacter sp.]